jgi:hypothetical protein
MRSSLVSFRQLRTSEQKAAIYDTPVKIDVTQQKIENVKIISLDSSAVRFGALQREIDDEIGLRSIAIEQTVTQSNPILEQHCQILEFRAITILGLTNRMTALRAKKAAELESIGEESMQHRLHEYEHQFYQIETKCEAALQVVRDKGAEMEGSHRIDEERLFGEKMTILNPRIEERIARNAAGTQTKCRRH